jgi:hypothetical protein
MLMRVTRALAAPTARAVKWVPMVLSLTAGLALLILNIAARDHIQSAQLLPGVRMCAVFGALSVAFLFDDAAATITAAAPVSLSVRRAVRVALALPVLGCWWAAVLAICASLAPQADLPVGALLLEGAALTAVTLALSAVCGRWVPEQLGGVAAAPGLLVAAGLANALPAPVEMFTVPDSPAWAASHYRWAGVLVVACAAVVLASWLPAGRRTPCARTGSEPSSHTAAGAA